MELNNEENKSSLDNTEKISNNENSTTNSVSTNKNPNNKKKKTNSSLLDIIIIILCLVVIALLIMYINKPDASITQIFEAPTEISQYRSDNFSRKKVSTVEPSKKTDRYYRNNVKINSVCMYNGQDYNIDVYNELPYDVGGERIEYFQLSGLNNKTIQDSINEEIKNQTFQLLERSKKAGEVESITITCYPTFNQANLLCVHYWSSADYLKLNDEYMKYYPIDEHSGDSYYLYSTFSDLYRLDTGEKLEFEELFAKNVLIKELIHKAIYPTVAERFYNDSNTYTESMEDVDYARIENTISKLLKNYDKYGVSDFSIGDTYFSFTIYDGKTDPRDYSNDSYPLVDGCTFSISYSEIETDNLCIYNIVKPSTSLYEEGNREVLSTVYKHDLASNLLYKGYTKSNYYLIVTTETSRDLTSIPEEEKNAFIEEVKNYTDEMYQVDKQKLNNKEWMIYLLTGYSDYGILKAENMQVTGLIVQTPKNQNAETVVQRLLDKLIEYDRDEESLHFELYDYGCETRDDYRQKYNYIVEVISRNLYLTNPDNYSYYNDGETYMTVYGSETLEDFIESYYWEEE